MAVQIEFRDGKVYSNRSDRPERLYEIASEEGMLAFIQIEQLPILLSRRISDLVEHRFPTDNLDRAILKAVESIEQEENKKIKDIPHNIIDLRKIIIRFCEQLDQHQNEKFDLAGRRSG